MHDEISEAIVANFLALTALDANKPIIGSFPLAIQFLTRSFHLPTSTQSQHDSLRALFNLSISPSNIPRLIDSGLVPHLLSSIGDDTVLSDRSLSLLSNIVSTAEGRNSVISTDDGIPILIDVLNWIDSPSCQERASYILMVISHKSETGRAFLIKCGVKSALLELVLVGSALAQKRAARILEILRVEKGKQVTMEGFFGLPAVSAPLIREAKGGGGGVDDDNEVGVSEERRAVKELVNESLQSNLRRIVKRANLVEPERFRGGHGHGHVQGKAVSTRSLPF